MTGKSEGISEGSYGEDAKKISINLGDLGGFEQSGGGRKSRLERQASENNYDDDNFEGYPKTKHTSTSRSRSN